MEGREAPEQRRQRKMGHHGGEFGLQAQGRQSVLVPFRTEEAVLGVAGSPWSRRIEDPPWSRPKDGVGGATSKRMVGQSAFHMDSNWATPE